MRSTDRLDINGLYRDHSSILVSNHSMVSIGASLREISNMCNLGSFHFSGVNRDHTNIGMANHSTSIGSRNHGSTLVDTSHTSYWHTSNRGGNVSSSLVELSLGSSNSSSMCSLGSLHFNSVNRDHTNIGMVSNSISIGSRNHGSNLVDTSHTIYRHTSNRGVNVSSSLVELSLGSSNSTSICSRNHRNPNGMFYVSSSLVEVSLSSSNSRGVGRDHSTIRVSHHGSMHSHGSRIGL